MTKNYVHETRSRGKSYYYLRASKYLGRMNIPLGRDRAQAEARAAEILREMKDGPRPQDEPSIMPGLEDRMEVVFASAKQRADANKLTFTISLQFVRNLLNAQGGRCAVTGIPFTLKSNGKNWRREPYRPSLDRIDSARGYEPDNCRIVCVAVNTALNEWGDEVFWTIVRGAVNQALSPTPFRISSRGE